MAASDVVNNDSGEFELSDTRTSTGTFLEAAQDEVVARIEKRVAQVTMTPLGAQGGQPAGCAVAEKRHMQPAASMAYM